MISHNGCSGQLEDIFFALPSVLIDVHRPSQSVHGFTNSIITSDTLLVQNILLIMALIILNTCCNAIHVMVKGLIS